MAFSRVALAAIVPLVFSGAGGCGQDVAPAVQSPPAPVMPSVGTDAAAAPAPSPSTNSQAAPAAVTGPTGLLYVPAYSHLTQREGKRTMLGITLSVRNVDLQGQVSLHRVDYFDTQGNLVRSYLDRPQRLRPLETSEFIVTTLDDTGGSGANFLVEWSASPGVQPLLAETLMAGHTGGGYLSFTSRGVVVRALPASPAPPPPAGSPVQGAGASPVSGPLDPPSATDSASD